MEFFRHSNHKPKITFFGISPSHLFQCYYITLITAPFWTFNCIINYLWYLNTFQYLFVMTHFLCTAHSLVYINCNSLNCGIAWWCAKNMKLLVGKHSFVLCVFSLVKFGKEVSSSQEIFQQSLSFNCIFTRAWQSSNRLVCHAFFLASPSSDFFLVKTNSWLI